MNRKILTFLLVSMIGITVASRTQPVAHQLRRCCDGDVWLSMNSQQRHSFAVGFIYGVQNGHKDGCFDYDEIAHPRFEVKSPEEIPVSRCMQHELQFRKSFAYYENRITTFYEKYPMDRDIPFSVIFSSISDTEDKPDEKIHEYMPRQAGGVAPDPNPPQ